MILFWATPKKKQFKCPPKGTLNTYKSHNEILFHTSDIQNMDEFQHNEQLKPYEEHTLHVAVENASTCKADWWLPEEGEDKVMTKGAQKNMRRFFRGNKYATYLTVVVAFIV